MKEFNTKNNEFEKIESEQNINIELMSNQIENMKRNEENILEENTELRKLLDQSNEKINELNLLMNKNIKFEEAIMYERSQREKIENINQQISQKLKENEIKTYSEFSKMKNFVVSKDEEMENMKNTYENKISKVFYSLSS